VPLASQSSCDLPKPAALLRVTEKWFTVPDFDQHVTIEPHHLTHPGAADHESAQKEPGIRVSLSNALLRMTMNKKLTGHRVSVILVLNIGVGCLGGIDFASGFLHVTFVFFYDLLESAVFQGLNYII
jgi:hypothetical protein